ncbi:hypothetical protein LJR235_004897 [Pararhizobium sp. LjRoot235]|uniref:hypothetical protein n=1 Tax=Pararhizobium sp. LjRoot235 TaxID=3342291 RepID=UPI003ECF11EB
MKTDSSVTNATVQSMINSYGNITTRAFLVFHNFDLGHGARDAIGAWLEVSRKQACPACAWSRSATSYAR